MYTRVFACAIAEGFRGGRVCSYKPCNTNWRGFAGVYFSGRMTSRELALLETDCQVVRTTWWAVRIFLSTLEAQQGGSSGPKQPASHQ